MSLRMSLWGALVLVFVPTVGWAGTSVTYAAGAAAFSFMNPDNAACGLYLDEGTVKGLGPPGPVFDCCVVAPAALPDSGEVTALSVYFVKETADFDLAVTLYRVDLFTAEVREMAEIDSASFSASTAVRVALDLSIADAMVDNSRYFYYIGTSDCLQTRFLELHAALVTVDVGGAP